MQKEIEKAVLKITQAMEKNRKEFVEVEGNYRDTGYDRYWNKMQKLDAEYEELRAFIQPKQELSQIKEMDELQRVVKNIKSKWEHLKSDIPITADSIGLESKKFYQKNNSSIWIYGIFKLAHLRKIQTPRKELFHV